LHEVHLEATSQYGCYDDTTITIEVYSYIYAKFTLDRPAICSDEPFTIDRSSSAGAINHYYWDYEDDGTNDEDKTDPVFDYTYSNAGITNLNPNIRLTVTNTQGCDTSWTESITVHPEVRAAFDLDTSPAYRLHIIGISEMARVRSAKILCMASRISAALLMNPSSLA
jgi:hypothetical protein